MRRFAARFNIVAFILAMAVIAPSNAGAGVIWDGNETGGLGVFKLMNYEGTGATASVTTDATYDQVFRFYKPVDAHRSEAHGADGFNPANGSTYFIGWRSKVTSTVTNNAIFQWKAYGTPMTQNYPIVLKCISGKLTLEQYQPGGVKTTLVSKTMSANTWYSHVLEIKVSDATTGGYIRYWLDGVAQTFPNGTTTFNCRTFDGSSVDPKWGIYGADATSITNYVTHLKIGTTFDDVANTVRVYQNNSYGGWLANFGVGSFTQSALVAAGGVNDDASSIKVPAGFKVTLYQNNNYGGTSIVKTANDSSFGDDSFNDTASSLKVEYTGN